MTGKICFLLLLTSVIVGITFSYYFFFISGRSENDMLKLEEAMREAEIKKKELNGINCYSDFCDNVNKLLQKD